MKFNFKSKLGFTLIELLVVIGILAVLAAIAIPSVAGLIDRANVSADATNANEMTNAVERFVSEYELYCQDLASNQVKLDNLDAAQGRVYNVTGADDRVDIEALEGAGLNGKQINIDTKYPTNVATMQAVVENYMKTSSTTFTPKQSDKHFWYSPEIGIVVYAKPDADVVTDLNSQVQSGKDAKGEKLDSLTIWIDITINITINNGTPNVDIDMSTVDNTFANNSWETIQKVAKAGKISETNWKIGDTKTVQVNGSQKTATIIGINHDGSNSITLMILDSLETRKMNAKENPNFPVGKNIGGWEGCEIRAYLAETIFPTMTDVKDYIKPVNKTTNNTGYHGTETTDTQDNLFLLSVNEVGRLETLSSNYQDDLLKYEGSTYEYFKTNSPNAWFWLRSSWSSSNAHFLRYWNGNIEDNYSSDLNQVCPAFVIG